MGYISDNLLSPNQPLMKGENLACENTGYFCGYNQCFCNEKTLNESEHCADNKGTNLRRIIPINLQLPVGFTELQSEFRPIVQLVSPQLQCSGSFSLLSLCRFWQESGMKL